MPISFARLNLSGLYVILDPTVSPNRLLIDALTQSAQIGARIFQYRNKMASMKEAYAEALPLRKMAAELGVLFIVNDRCDLALTVDADGMHLGQGDLPFAYARKIMGPDKLIGLSTHNPDQVKEAERLKPDYIGFGPIFKPASKQDHDPVVGLVGSFVTAFTFIAVIQLTLSSTDKAYRLGILSALGDPFVMTIALPVTLVSGVFTSPLLYFSLRRRRLAAALPIILGAVLVSVAITTPLSPMLGLFSGFAALIVSCIACTRIRAMNYKACDDSI